MKTLALLLLLPCLSGCSVDGYENWIESTAYSQAEKADIRNNKIEDQINQLLAQGDTLADQMDKETDPVKLKAMVARGRALLLKINRLQREEMEN